MKIGIVGVAALLCAGLNASVVQEDERSDANVDKLASAIQALAEEKEFVLSGSVTLEEPDSGGAQHMIVINGGGSGGGEEYAGPVEIWRTHEDELVIASRDALPGFGFFDNGERSITQLNYEDVPVRASSLTSDLVALLDLNRLKRSVRKTDLDSKTGQDGKALVFRGEISKRILRGGGGSPIQLLAPQVLRVETEFTLDDKMRLVSLKFIVVRSDPFAGLRRKALEGELDGGIEITSERPDLSEDEGKRYIYTLNVSKKGPSDRAKALLEQVREMLKDEVF